MWVPIDNSRQDDHEYMLKFYQNLRQLTSIWSFKTNPCPIKLVGSIKTFRQKNNKKIRIFYGVL